MTSNLSISKRDENLQFQALARRSDHIATARLSIVASQPRRSTRSHAVLTPPSDSADESLLTVLRPENPPIAATSPTDSVPDPAGGSQSKDRVSPHPQIYDRISGRSPHWDSLPRVAGMLTWLPMDYLLGHLA